jgi:hypothetical protein
MYPEDLVKAIRAWLPKAGDVFAEETTDLEINPRVIRATEASKKLRNEFLDEIEHNIQTSSKEKLDSLAAWARAGEMFAKLELLAAGSRGAEGCKIEREDTERAIALSRAGLHAKAESMDQYHPSDTDFLKAQKTVLAVLTRRSNKGQKTMTRTTLMQGTRVGAAMLSRVMVDLIGTKRILSDASLQPDGQRLLYAGSIMALPENKKAYIAAIKKSRKN